MKLWFCESDPNLLYYSLVYVVATKRTERKWEQCGSSGAQLQGDLLCCLDGWEDQTKEEAVEAAATTTAQLSRKQRKFVQVLVCLFLFFFSLEHSMNLMSLKLNNNTYLEKLKLLRTEFSGSSSSLHSLCLHFWSSHPSRKLKISHYLQYYHFKNVILDMPKTGHNFVYRDRVCS